MRDESQNDQNGKESPAWRPGVRGGEKGGWFFTAAYKINTNTGIRKKCLSAKGLLVGGIQEIGVVSHGGREGEAGIGGWSLEASGQGLGGTGLGGLEMAFVVSAASA